VYVEVKNREEIFNSIVEKETAELMGISFPCICGKNHSIPIEYLSIKKGAVEDIRSSLGDIGVQGKGTLIYDRVIEENVVSTVRLSLRDQGLSIASVPVGDGREKIPPEIERSSTLAERVGKGVDYLVSCGSGVVSDLTKYAAALLEKPCILIPTAPSMNGYTSSMAALTESGIKKTLMIPPAKAIFADLSILTSSPLDMVRAGLGDIVSKSVCSADWKLSQLVKKTYFCPLPFHITDKSEPHYLEAAEEIGRRSEEAISVLTDGIMRSGLSMTVIGTSTPSSGAEHTLSHYWDLMALKEGREKNFHGTQVGVTTIIMLRLFDFIRNYPLRRRLGLNMTQLKRDYPSRSGLKKTIKKKFGAYAEGVEQEFFAKYMDWEEKKMELEYIVENWDPIWNELEEFIRPTGPAEQALKRCGAPAYYTDLGKTKEDVLDDIMHTSYIRGRYTILDLAMDLGILREAAESVL
jgi:glycerol-1-phosphate dehydrogenase [NAD(P)+]